MLALYIGCLVVGGGLVALSLMGGDIDGHDMDSGADADADAGADGDAGADHAHGPGADAASAWLPFLSLRFWTFSVAFFGLMGLAVNLLTAVPLLLEVGSALGVGLTAGLGVSWGIHRLQLGNVDSSVRPQELLGTEGRVTLPLEPGRRGKIRALVGGRQLDLIAETVEPGTIGIGEDVVICELDGPRVRVVRAQALLPHEEGNA